MASIEHDADAPASAASVTSPIDDVDDLFATGLAEAHEHGDRHSHSYAGDKARLLARLRRIEGQVRGVARMIEDDKYCIDVLTQVSAIMASTRAVGMLVLQDHIRGCVVDSPPDEREGRIEELNLAIERFTRM